MTTTNFLGSDARASDGVLSIGAGSPSEKLHFRTEGTGQATSYTLIYDAYIPASGALRGWVPFFQTDVSNGSDGDLFGRLEGGHYGIGISGDYQGSANLDAWNRIGFTVETLGEEVTIKKFINGVLVGSQITDDVDRYTIDKTSGFLIFSDESNETSDVHLSNLAFAEAVLSEADMRALGGARSEGIVTEAIQAAFTEAGGSEFRFNNGSLQADLGAATLDPSSARTTLQTVDAAGIAEITEPDAFLSIPAGSSNETILVNPGGTGMVGVYTLAFDVYVPSESATSGWMPFFQTDINNGNDGDLFAKIENGTFGIGISSVYDGRAELDAWHRIIFTIETEDGTVTINKYINGELAGTQTTSDVERYAIDKESGFLIFSDNDDETSGVHLSNFAYMEAKIGADQIAQLGGPSSEGIIPSSYWSEMEQVNGSEFHFDDGSLNPAIGHATITLQDIDATIQTASEADIPQIEAPDPGSEAEPIRLRSIDDMLLTEDAGQITIDLSEHFTQPDLSDYAVTSSDGTVIGAQLREGAILELDVEGLGRSDIHIEAKDASGQVYVDDFRVRIAGEHAYTIAVMPDTQSYTYAGTRQDIFNGMTQWLAEQSDNIDLRFVSFVGDITDNNTVGQWAIAKEAIEKLNGFVPYAMLPGNHDQPGNAQTYGSRQTDFFSIDYLKEHSTLGGVYDQEPGESKNAWYTFDGADGTKWIDISLEFGARDDVLRWANEVLDAHADYRAILTTHHYTNMGTRADNYSGPLFGEGTGKDYGIGASAENANDGEDMWQELVSKHSNIEFVFSGHVFGDGAETIVSYNEAGEPVYQMLVNYQDGVSLENTGNGDISQGGNGGNGAIRLLTIDPDNDTVYTETYLSAFDEYLTGSRGDPEPSRDGKGGEETSGSRTIQPVTFGREMIDTGESGIITTPHFDPANGLKITPGFDPEGGGTTYDAYTLIWDVKFPSEGNGLSSIFQGDLNNITDGDLWLNFRDGFALIGTNGQDEGRVPLDAYTRIVVTLEKSGVGYTMKKYVDGVLQGTQTVGGEYDITSDGFLIFADDSSETPIASLSSFAFMETALGSDEVEALGGPTADGPYAEAPNGVNMVQFDFENGDFAPTIGSGTLSQEIGGSTSGVQLTGALREHQETINDIDLGGQPAYQFHAEAGDDQVLVADASGAASVRLDAGGTVDKLDQIQSFEWFNQDGERVAKGPSADLDLEAGVHQLTLKVSDEKGTASTDTIKIAIMDAATLLHESFDDGGSSDWQLPGSGGWQVAGSFASRSAQTEAIAAPEGAMRAFDGGSGIALWAGEGSVEWSDYTISANLTAEDQKAFGLVAYYQDADNYYRLSFDIADNERLLIKVQDGEETVLARETKTSPFDRAMPVELAVSDGKLFASLDGEALFDGPVEDTSPLSGGTIGLYSEGQRQVFFDDIFVETNRPIADAGKSIRLIDEDGDGFSRVQLSALSSFGLEETTSATWSEEGRVLATGTETSVALVTGSHLLTLALDDQAGTTRDTVQVDIIPGTHVLLEETFDDGVANDFRFVDEGELGEAANWTVENGQLIQSANRYSRELGGSGDTAPTAQWTLNWSPLGDGIHALRKGTYALYEGDGAFQWDDYSVEASFSASAGGGVGLLLHYADANNYYKFELDDRTGLPQLFSLVDGIEQTLWQGPMRYDISGDNHLRADISQGQLQVWLNDVALFTKPIEIHDTEEGTFGLYNWGNEDVTYDDVQVIRLEPQGSGEIPDSGGGTVGGDGVTGGGSDPVIDTGTESGDVFENPTFPGSIDGGAGIDRVSLPNAYSDYVLTSIDGGFALALASDPSKVIDLSNVEVLQFGDLTLERNDSPEAATIYGLYGSIFGRTPDLAGISFWVDANESGVSLETVAEFFTQSAEFIATYGTNPTDDALVDGFFDNILGRSGDAEGEAFWKEALDKGLSTADLLLGFAQSSEFVGLIDNQIDDGIFVIQ